MARRLRGRWSGAVSAGRGGWSLADAQRFWLSMRAQGVTGAVGLDGGDVAQAVWRNPDDSFTVLAPRIATPHKPERHRASAKRWQVFRARRP